MYSNEFDQNEEQNSGRNNLQKNKTIFLIVIIIAIFVIGYFILLKSSDKDNNSGVNNIENNTENINENISTPTPSTTPIDVTDMSNLYPDADLICETINHKTDEGSTMTSHAYIYFNKDGYRTKIYMKSNNVYDNLTDEMFNEIQEKLCKANSDSCAFGTAVINEPDFGFNIERKGNTIIITEYAFRGNGLTADVDFIEEIKQQFYTRDGMTCK